MGNADVLTKPEVRDVIIKSEHKDVLPEGVLRASRLSRFVGEFKQIGWRIDPSLVSQLSSTKTLGKQAIGVEYALRKVFEIDDKKDSVATVGATIIDVLKRKGNGKSWCLPSYLSNLLVDMSKQPQKPPVASSKVEGASAAAASPATPKAEPEAARVAIKAEPVVRRKRVPTPVPR